MSTFLGSPIEICLVTKDFRRTITGLSQLGIGPWRIYTFTPENTTDQTYRGKSSPFTMRVCFADLSPTMVYEVIQPISGPNIFQEFLDQHGEGRI
jgi:methylmalonyl-CoA/ethylmalonyl-CoA epimerase